MAAHLWMPWVNADHWHKFHKREFFKGGGTFATPLLAATMRPGNRQTDGQCHCVKPPLLQWGINKAGGTLGYNPETSVQSQTVRWWRHLVNVAKSREDAMFCPLCYRQGGAGRSGARDEAELLAAE